MLEKFRANVLKQLAKIKCKLPVHVIRLISTYFSSPKTLASRYTGKYTKGYTLKLKDGKITFPLFYKFSQSRLMKIGLYCAALMF